MGYEFREFFIDGRWVQPAEPREWTVINPATEGASGVISLGNETDVDRAVGAARRAFEGFSRTTALERRALLERILALYKSRYEEFVTAIMTEMGAPISLARSAQAAIGIGHLNAAIEVLERFPFEEQRGRTRIVYEPVGVCGLITPWNWPINQVAAKAVPALAAGCTMVLKPSEFSPFSAMLWAQVLEEAGVPPGVFNLVNGDGALAGAALASHPDVDMVSFTGSTRGGIEVARAAASTVKRVHQELGGKSPSILLEDADLQRAVEATVRHVMRNSGQSCNAPTRMLVPASKCSTAESIAKQVCETAIVGDTRAEETGVGPLVSRIQFDRVRGYIRSGIEEGARLVSGGLERPAGISKGYFLKPTVFADVHNQMTIAREEIFGPVLCILPYKTEEEAVQIANDTPYGLAAYVWSTDPTHARAVATRVRAGQVIINGAQADMYTPFGGFKQSGNGREWGEFGLRDFLEIKAVVGT
jgi:aldehyde dehydrogenase (NAD+)